MHLWSGASLLQHWIKLVSIQVNVLTHTGYSPLRSDCIRYTRCRSCHVSNYKKKKKKKVVHRNPPKTPSDFQNKLNSVKTNSYLAKSGRRRIWCISSVRFTSRGNNKLDRKKKLQESLSARGGLRKWFKRSWRCSNSKWFLAFNCELGARGTMKAGCKLLTPFVQSQMFVSGLLWSCCWHKSWGFEKKLRLRKARFDKDCDVREAVGQFHRGIVRGYFQWF